MHEPEFPLPKDAFCGVWSILGLGSSNFVYFCNFVIICPSFEVTQIPFNKVFTKYFVSPKLKAEVFFFIEIWLLFIGIFVVVNCTQGCFVEKMKMWTDYRQMGRWRKGIRKAFSSDELKMFVFNEWKIKTVTVGTYVAHNGMIFSVPYMQDK